MFIRLAIAAALLLTIVTHGASSRAVDVADTSVTVDNVTLGDDSTKSFDISGGSFHKVRDVGEIAKLGPMCQCLCTNVGDVDVQIRSVPRLDSSEENALKAGESHFFEVRAVRQNKEPGANVSDVKLDARNGSHSAVDSTDKELKGNESNVTDSASIAASIVIGEVDVQLLKLDANVTDESAVNSTLNSTDHWLFPKSMEDRVVDSKLDEDVFGESANISNITSVILGFVLETMPNVSSLIVDRENGQDVDGFDDTSFDEADMDLEGLVLLKNEGNDTTANANITSSADFKGSEIKSDE